MTEQAVQTEEQYRAKVRAWAVENGLTEQEVEVIERVAVPKFTYKKIAEELDITEYAVKKTVKGIGANLGWRSGIGRMDICCMLIVKFSMTVAEGDPEMSRFAQHLEQDLEGKLA